MYRIYTENVNKVKIVQLTNSHFQSYSLLSDIDGYWQGHCEHALVLEIATDNNADIYQLAHEIKQANHQESVLVSQSTTKDTLV